MRDRLSKERRSWNMSRIRWKNTSPDRIVRRLLLVVAIAICLTTLYGVGYAQEALKVVGRSLLAKKSGNPELPHEFDVGRPFAISLATNVTNGASLRTNLIAACRAGGVLEKVVFSFYDAKRTSAVVEVQIGMRVPVEIAQCAFKALQSASHVTVTLREDDDAMLGISQRIVIVTQTTWNRNAPKMTVDKWRSLLKPGLSREEYRRLLLGPSAMRASPAHTKIMAAQGTNGAPMALIPAGPFQMGNHLPFGGEPQLKPGQVLLGSNRQTLVANLPDHPPHTVQVSAFHIDRFEVSVALWNRVKAWGHAHGYRLPLEDIPVRGKGTNHPVFGIAWHDTVKWCNARSEMEGLTPVYYADATHQKVYRSGELDLPDAAVKWAASGYRLPTEAEWEKAARGGLAGRFYPWGNTTGQTYANFRVPSKAPFGGYHPTWHAGDLPYTSPVGSFAPNGFGLYDVIGNVEEWCWDKFDRNWYRNPASTQPDTRGPDSGTGRVRRGGSYSSGSPEATLSWRWGAVREHTTSDVGFRCVRRP